MVAPNPFDLPRHDADCRREIHIHCARRHDARRGSRFGRWLQLATPPTVCALLLSLILPVAVATAQDDDEAEAEPPAGDYTVAITEDDIPSDLTNGPDLIGRWQIFLRPDGTYSLRRADVGEVAVGSYTVEDETIAITDEGGLLSCVNAAPTGGAGIGTATGTYGWEFDEDDGLTLSPIEEGCGGRALILSTRPLDFFVACTTEAIPIPPPVGDAGDEEGSDDTAETDEDEATEDDEAAEDDEDDGALDDPFGGGDEDEATEDADADAEDVEIDEDEADEGIDAVLGQLTACWTTQDPARILPLFSSVFLDGFVDEAGSLYDVAGIFGQIMAIPITWERAGEIELDGASASALVSQTIGAEESFVRFQFVFEDGVWKLASFG